MKYFIIICGFLIYAGNCARILGVFPLPGKSHYILGSALMKELAERGHDVTIITPFTEKEKPKNGSYTEIELFELMKEMKSKNFIFKLNH